MNYKNYTDEELIRMLRGGKTDIADFIMEKYKPLVRKKTNAMYLIGGEPEDLIQEGMIGLFKAVRDYREDKETSFFSFADLCISRQLYSALEMSNRKKHMPLNTYVSFSNQENTDGVKLEEVVTEQTISPEQMFIEQEGQEEFAQKLQENLSALEKTVLYLYLEGNSYTQIAAILSKSPKSVDNSLQRIKAKIKQLKQ
jgi:RNA polymerase sporulation-specific sigma factor